MGRALYNLIVTLDLERISLGGSVFWHHREYLLPKLQACVKGKLPALTDGCELVPAGLGDQVGDWGALSILNSDHFTSAGRNLKGAAGWNCAAALPAKIAPPVSVSFFVGAPAAKSMSTRSTQNTFGLRTDSKK